jgi:hypothetical protein
MTLALAEPTLVTSSLGRIQPFSITCSLNGTNTAVKRGKNGICIFTGETWAYHKVTRAHYLAAKHFLLACWPAGWLKSSGVASFRKYSSCRVEGILDTRGRECDARKMDCKQPTLNCKADADCGVFGWPSERKLSGDIEYKLLKRRHWGYALR